jgi:hypothetical protein
MKLEFLEEINEYQDHLIRLYDFDMEQAKQFKAAIQETIIKNGNALNLNSLPFIEALNCKLTLHIADEDEGIITMDNQIFFCDLTMDGYKNMLRLIEPYCNKNTRSSQMLYDIDTEIDFLFAPYGAAID